MKKWGQIIDEDTKMCAIGTGTDEAYYQSIGMTLEEVEQDENGVWYLKGYAPKP